ncbi:PFL_4695 family integrating conjugative element protein [Vibrio sp. 1180_3]|uniref:PFL_4695 family integrating conjugative element protein n=1 Tax=Vibrio sp. 1180_3 TaxID=2528832 RepID=UPI0024057ED3|nr:integrating conjugative element protein [Vibrio sp. 1180_3]MDF9399103.1 integrating conjugative element protein [Vibrio sp. 1180_3]
MKKPATALLLSLLPILASANVVTVKTVVTKTKAKPLEEKELVYDRPEISEQELGVLVDQEALRLNHILRTSTMNVLRDFKSGKPSMVVLGSNPSESKPIREVIRQDELEVGENRKRELSELAQLERFKNGEISKQDLHEAALRSIFPVTTTLKPTKLPSRLIKLSPEQASRVQRPIAVIGADSYSLEWLKLNVGAIRRHRAGIVVTQVNSMTDFLAIKKYAPDIEMQPVDAKQFLQNLGVSVYPIIITQEGAIQ